MPLSLPNFLLRPQRGTGSASSSWMLIWPFGQPEGHTSVAAGRAQSRAKHCTSALHQPHMITNVSLFRAVLWALGANLGKKNHSQGTTQETVTQSQLSYLLGLPHISICKAEVVILPCVCGCRESDTTAIHIIQTISRLTSNCYI